MECSCVIDEFRGANERRKWLFIFVRKIKETRIDFYSPEDRYQRSFT